MESWTTTTTTTTNNDCGMRERAVNQSAILRRWALETLIGNPLLQHTTSSQDMMEMLQACLHSWRQVVRVVDTTTTTTTIIGQPQPPASVSSDVVQLLGLVEKACQYNHRPVNNNSSSTTRSNLLPGDKAYSMCFNVLAKDPTNPTIPDTIQRLLHQRLEQSTAPPPGLLFYNACLNALAKCSPYHEEAPQRAETIFQNITLCPPDTACFVSLMHAWASSPLPRSAERAQAILDQMIKSSFSQQQQQQQQQLHINPRCFNVCLDGWAKAGKPDKAEELLWRMMMYQGNNHNNNNSLVKPNDISFNSVLNAWAKSRHPQAANRAEMLLYTMESYGIPPTCESYNAVMDAWSRTTSQPPGPKVQSMLDRLENGATTTTTTTTTVVPNKLMYVVAIHAWAQTTSTRQYDAPEQAQALFSRMKEFSRDNRPELRPCVRVYSALIDAWAKSSRPDAPERAVSLFREMQVLSESGRTEVTPNTITLNTVLDAFARQGRAEEAYALLKETTKDDRGNNQRGVVVQPDIISYDTVMKGYSKSKAWDAGERASELLREMEVLYCSDRNRHPLRPTVHTYTLAILAWGNSRSHDAAEKAEHILWHMMGLYDKGNNSAAKPNVVTFNCVLRAWSRNNEGGAAERAESIFHWMKETGMELDIEPNATSYMHIIFTWANSGRRHAHKMAEKYLNELKGLCFNGNKGFVLTAGHFNATIRALTSSRNESSLEKVESLVDEMIHLAKSGHRTTPNTVTFNYLMKAINQSEAPDKQEKLESVARQRSSCGVKKTRYEL